MFTVQKSILMLMKKKLVREGLISLWCQSCGAKQLLLEGGKENGPKKLTVPSMKMVLLLTFKTYSKDCHAS